MHVLQLSSLCITLTTMLFGAMHSRWPSADWWPSAASIWSPLQSRLDPSHNESRGFSSTSDTNTPSLEPADGGQQPRLACTCKALPTNGPAESVDGFADGTRSTTSLVILVTAVAFIIGLCLIDWVQLNGRPGSKKRVSETSLTHRSTSTTPERGRPLHRYSRPVNSLPYFDKQASHFFTRPVEVKKWIFSDGSASTSGNYDGPSTIDPRVCFNSTESEKNAYRPLTDCIRQANECRVENNEVEEPENSVEAEAPEVSDSVLLPTILEAVGPANTGGSETHRPVLFEETTARNSDQDQDYIQQTKLFDDMRDTTLKPLISARPANTGSTVETKSSTAPFEETIAWSRTVQRVGNKFNERLSNQLPLPPFASLDIANLTISNLTKNNPLPTKEPTSFDNTAVSSSKNKIFENIHRQHLADKFKELESYQSSSNSSGSLDGSSAEQKSSFTDSNGWTRNEDTDMIFHFEPDGNSPSPPKSSSSSPSASASPPFGGYQDPNGCWVIDEALTLPFFGEKHGKSGKKRRNRRRPRKSRAGRKLDEETEAEAEVQTEAETGVGIDGVEVDA